MKPAPILERMAAFIIDYFLLVILAVMVAQVMPSRALMMYSMLICSILYNTIAIASSWQATPGMRLMQMRVISVRGRPLNELDSLERYLTFYLPFLPIYLSVAPAEVLSMAASAMMLAWFVPILTRRDHRGVHDVICGTVMVSAPR